MTQPLTSFWCQVKQALHMLAPSVQQMAIYVFDKEKKQLYSLHALCGELQCCIALP